MAKTKIFTMDVTETVAVFDSNAYGNKMMIVADPDNSAAIYIGDVDSQEIKLNPGDSTAFMDIEKVNEILVYGTSGDKAQAIVTF